MNIGGGQGLEFGGGGANSQQAHDVVTTSMRRNDVASTSFRRHVPTRIFLLNQCQIITFILKYDIIENSRIELRGIVLPVQMGGLLGGGGEGAKGMLAPLSNNLGGRLPPPPPPPSLWPPPSYAHVYRAVSQRERERERKKREVKDERKNVQTAHTRTYCKYYRPFLALLPSKLVGRPALEVYPAPSHHPTPTPPPLSLALTNKIQLSKCIHSL